MFAQQAEIAAFEAPLVDHRERVANHAVVEFTDDDLAPARGFALGLLFGAASLLGVGAAIWWAA